MNENYIQSKRSLGITWNCLGTVIFDRFSKCLFLVFFRDFFELGFFRNTCATVIRNCSLQIFWNLLPLVVFFCKKYKFKLKKMSRNYLKFSYNFYRFWDIDQKMGDIFRWPHFPWVLRIEILLVEGTRYRRICEWARPR